MGSYTEFFGGDPGGGHSSTPLNQRTLSSGGAQSITDPVSGAFPLCGGGPGYTAFDGDCNPLILYASGLAAYDPTDAVRAVIEVDDNLHVRVTTSGNHCGVIFNGAASSPSRSRTAATRRWSPCGPGTRSGSGRSSSHSC